MKKRLLLLALLLLAAAPAYAATPNFIDPAVIPDSLAFLPPPPEDDSIDFKRDHDIYQETRKYKDTDRWKQATFDADRRANWRDFYTEAFGMKISEESTPATYELISKTFADFNASAASAKDYYKRIRPYVYYNQPDSTCLPAAEKALSTNGSYPSGHSNYGWGMALILSEISPERTSAIMKRGYEFGYSRIICGVHWASDVEAGRYLAGIAVAMMHDSPKFLDMLAKAKAEIRAIREKTKP